MRMKDKVALISGAASGMEATPCASPSWSPQKAALPAARAQSAKLAPRTVPLAEVGVHMAAIIIEAMVLLPAFRRRAAARGQSLAAAGFTLIELMVVLVIIGVLAARTDVNNLMQALKLYRLDNQRYPTGEQGLQALVARPAAAPAPANWKPYLDKLPSDPWGRAYQYLNPGVKGEIDVMSFGADGQPGGEGKNADIGTWQ